MRSRVSFQITLLSTPLWAVVTFFFYLKIFSFALYDEVSQTFLPSSTSKAKGLNAKRVSDIFVSWFKNYAKVLSWGEEKSELSLFHWKRSLMMSDYSWRALSIEHFGMINDVLWIQWHFLSSHLIFIFHLRDDCFPFASKWCSFRCKWLGIIKVVNVERIWISNLFLR